jgi:hypothetical protein
LIIDHPEGISWELLCRDSALFPEEYQMGLQEALETTEPDMGSITASAQVFAETW